MVHALACSSLHVHPTASSAVKYYITCFGVGMRGAHAQGHINKCNGCTMQWATTCQHKQQLGDCMLIWLKQVSDKNKESGVKIQQAEMVAKGTWCFKCG